MNGEQIHEKGIVREVNNGVARVELLRTDHCEECSAKIFCKPKDNDSNFLEVSDPLGVKPGDEVTINIEGSDIFKASLKLYGVPLVLLLAGIFIAYPLIKNELLSFLIGVGVVGIYYVIAYFFWSGSEKKVLPTIIHVK